MMSGEERWCLIESDPGVFTEMIQGFGATGVQVEDVWSLDKELFKTLEPIHGLIFLFKYSSENQPDGVVIDDEKLLGKIFFAKQVVSNACATYAILNVLLNCKHPDVNLGPTLQEIKEYCQGMNSYERGVAIGTSSVIRNVHNSFARQNLLDTRQLSKAPSHDLFHYVGFVPIDGVLYEFDGLQLGPISLGPICKGAKWTDTARPIIIKRMEQYSEKEIRFNLMAIISDKILVCRRKISSLRRQVRKGTKKSSCQRTEVAKLERIIAEEKEKRKEYEIESVRRKHDYTPLIMEILKILGRKRKLVDLYELAKERSTIKRKRLKLE